MDEIGLLEKQRDVQRKLGRCLLLLQQYELIAKHLVAHCSLEGAATDDFETARDERVRTIANWTLGLLAKNLTGDVIKPEVNPNDADDEREPPMVRLGKPWVRTTSAVMLPAETFDEFKAQLDQLVLLRNALVHHFLQRFNVFNDEGCDAALTHLDSCAGTIEGHVTSLKGWLNHMDEARRNHAVILSRPDIQAFLKREFSPGPPADISPEHPLVVCLTKAEGAVARDGWTLLTDAIKYLRTVAPDQTPKKYQVRNWQQVIRRSQVFEVKKDVSLSDAAITIWYRSTR